MFLMSWAALMGPFQYATHLISGPRLPFTATYFGSIIMTIYFAVGVSTDGSATIAMLSHSSHIAFANHAGLASLHHPDTDFCHHPACGIGVVSRQLFSNGKHGASLCCKGRR